MTLTPQQQVVVEEPGNFFLAACPGSGKTRSAAARGAVLANQRKRLAICSYTNVGADRIGHALMEQFGARIGPEHFVGTLHGFLLRFVFYPFAHAYGARAGPRVAQVFPWPEVLVGGDRRRRLSVDSFRLSPERSLILKPGDRPFWIRPEDEEQLLVDLDRDVKLKKWRLFQAGIVSADDSMFFSLELLRSRPDLARHVAARFDELLLDEAQDTSELQLACVDELKSTGNRASLVLVGDLEQSIFSFQGASAERVRALAERHGLKVVELSENHRSSQRICNAAAHFSGRGKPDEAVGPDAGCAIEPEVVLYPPEDAASATEAFRRRLGELSISPADAAVLARSNQLVGELTGRRAVVSVQSAPEKLGVICGRLRAGTATAVDISWVQGLVARSAFGGAALELLDDDTHDEVRTAAVRFANRLPTFDTDLQSWIRGAAEALGQTARELASEPRHRATQLLRTSPAHAEHRAGDVFVRPAGDLSAQTVHDIKGQERDAVMVVIDRPRGTRHGSQAKLWGSFISGEEIEEQVAEERRIAFVALTRARRYCLVALPDDEPGRLAMEAFVEAGFARIGV